MVLDFKHLIIFNFSELNLFAFVFELGAGNILRVPNALFVGLLDVAVGEAFTQILLVDRERSYHFVVLVRLVDEVLLVEVGSLGVLVRIAVVVIEVELLINLIIDNLNLVGLLPEIRLLPLLLYVLLLPLPKQLVESLLLDVLDVAVKALRDDYVA